MSRPNSSSSAMTSSTVSSESAPRSSMNLASGASWSTETSSSRAMISLAFSSLYAMPFTSFTCVIPRVAPAGDSGHHHPAVHVPHLSGDVAGAGRGQEAHHLGDVGGFAEPSEGNRLPHLVLLFLVQGIGHRGPDVARRDRVDGHAARRELPGQGTGQTDDARLGGGVIGLAGVAHQSHHRGDVDDAAALLLEQGARGGAAAVERALEVRVEHLVPLQVGHAQEKAVARDSRVVDEDIETRHALQHGIERGLNLRLVGDVGDERLGLAALGAHLGTRRLGALEIPGDDGDLRPVPGQRVDDGAADPGRAAGDDRDLAFELEPRGGSAHRRRGRAHAPAPLLAGSAASASSRLAGSSTFTLFASGAICLRRPRSTLPLPSSTNAVTSSPRRWRIDSSQRTAPRSWRPRRSRISAAFVTGRASTLATTGQAASCTDTAASAATRPSAAGPMSGEWNAPETGRRSARFAPAALNAGRAASTASTSPETTTWPGELKLAATTVPAPDLVTSAHTASTWSPARPSTAAIAPGRTRPASAMSSPRRRTTRSASA